MASRRAEEAGSIDDVGLALEDGANQLRIFVGVVLEIGVLDDHHVAGRLADAAPHRRALALIVRLEQNADAVVPVQLLEDFPGPILRPIIDDHQLLFDGTEIDFEYAGDDGADGGLLVVRRHDDTELHPADECTRKTAEAPPILRRLPFPSLPGRSAFSAKAG